MFQERSTRLATLTALALCIGACGDDTSSPSEEGETVAAYVASVFIDGTEGALRTSGIPRPTNGGPSISVDGHLTIVNGGTATLAVTAPTTFETVYVAGSSPISGLFLPVSGFYEVALPSPTTSADLLITFPQALPGNEFELYFAVEDESGRVGTLAERSFDALVVGTGDIQVTVAWNRDSDVDLHVVDPSGAEVYWGDRQCPSGGALDLDSNAACSIDGVRNENITWGIGIAPQGTYTVRLDYWSSCNVSQTDYTVLINNGGEIAIHHETFYGPGDYGGYGSGILIDSFTRTTGPMPGAFRTPATRVVPAGAANKLSNGTR